MQETEDIVTRLEQYRNGMWPVHECLRLADAWTTGVDLDDLPQWRIVVAVLAQEVREAATTIATLRAEVASLKTVMVAAAEEISAHWQAHCDAEGYGPQNLVRRLEEGIPSEYGYTAGAFAALRAEVEGLRADAERYRWLRDLKCNSFSVGKDEDHACNYMTASDWIDNNPDWYRDDNPAEVQRMRDTNTIWRLQVYPHTPVGFNVWNASTLDAAIDAAKADKEGA